MDRATAINQLRELKQRIDKLVKDVEATKDSTTDEAKTVAHLYGELKADLTKWVDDYTAKSNHHELDRIDENFTNPGLHGILNDLQEADGDELPSETMAMCLYTASDTVAYWIEKLIEAD